MIWPLEYVEFKKFVEGVDSLYRSSKHNKTYEQYDTRKINSVLTLVSLGKLITKSIILNTDKVKLSYKFLEAVSYKFPHCINWWITVEIFVFENDNTILGLYWLVQFSGWFQKEYYFFFLKKRILKL